MDANVGLKASELELVERINRMLCKHGQEIVPGALGRCVVLKRDANDMSSHNVLMRHPSFPEPVPMAAFIVECNELQELARQLEACEPILLPSYRPTEPRTPTSTAEPVEGEGNVMSSKAFVITRDDDTGGQAVDSCCFFDGDTEGFHRYYSSESPNQQDRPWVGESCAYRYSTRDEAESVVRSHMNPNRVTVKEWTFNDGRTEPFTRLDAEQS